MKIEFQHSREITETSNGTTTCTVTWEDGSIYRGKSICSKNDQFVKEIGRRVALTDAIRELSKEDRADIHSTYNSRNF